MVRKVVITAVALASAAAGLVSGRATGVPVASVRAAGSPGCEGVHSFASELSTRLARPDGLWAVTRNGLVSLSADRSSEPAGVSAGSIVKHIAVSADAGTAYVVDRVGDDEVIVVTPEGTRRLRQHGEVTHPAWSSRGDLAWATGSSIAVLDAGSGRVRRLASPVEGATLFSPVFVSARRVAAVVSMPPTAEVPEGERLGNLWVTRLDGRGWRRLTTFTAGTDRWVTVRTPIVHAGTVHFVKVSGRGSASRPPRFELWKLDHGVVRRVDRLPGERYLAGSRGSKLVWNVPDAVTGRQIIALDGPGGVREIGCGSIMTDPLDVVDPDRRAGTGHNVPPRGDWPELAPSAPSHTEEIAVIVGDFVTSAEAAGVAHAIRAAFPSSQVDVVDSSIAPSAIKPGVFGALLHLPDDADPTVAMAEFRSRLPEFAPNSWIVTP
jgi:hypothetical protein